MPSHSAVSINLRAAYTGPLASFIDIDSNPVPDWSIANAEGDITEWLTKKITEQFAIPGHLLSGAGTVTAPPNKLRMDARLLQILAGVRRGDIAVEDAALEIIEGRQLDRRSFLADTDPKPVFDREEMWKIPVHPNCRSTTESDAAFRARLKEQMKAYPQYDDRLEADMTLFGMPVFKNPALDSNELYVGNINKLMLDMKIKIPSPFDTGKVKS